MEAAEVILVAQDSSATRNRREEPELHSGLVLVLMEVEQHFQEAVVMEVEEPP
jgi:hypothetical protein